MEKLSVNECKQWWEDHVCKNYFTEYAFAFSQLTLIEKFNLNKQSFILEIGCGYGRETKPFTGISDNVFATDISKSSVELTKKHAPSANVFEYDGTNLINLQDNVFDLVYSCFVIQHMSKENAITILKKVYQLLKLGGHILFEFFDCAWLFNGGGDKDAFSGDADGNEMYNNGYSLDDITALCTKLGMVIEWIHSINHGILPSEKGETLNHWVCIKKSGGI